MNHKIYGLLACVSMLVSGWNATLSAETVTEGFNGFKGGYNQSWTYEVICPDGWDYSGTPNEFATGDTYHTAKPSVEVSGANTSTYLITPMLEGDFDFWIRNYTKYYQASATAYACTYNDGALVLGPQIGTATLAKSNSPTWQNIKFNSPTATRVALLISRAYLDDFSYTPAEQPGGPSLVVMDYSNGSGFDFGVVEEGFEKTFNLINQGTEDLIITNISITGDYTFVAGNDLSVLAPDENAEISISTPGKDSSGVLTIVSNDPASPYVITLTSTLKVPKPIMIVDPVEISLGKVVADASGNFSVANTGEATLYATLTSDNPDFGLSQTQLSVEPDESAEITVNYTYSSETFGPVGANITVSPNAGDPVVVRVTANAVNPNLWEEDFEDGEMPAEWSNNGWTVEKTNSLTGNESYMAYAGITSNTTLTTPRLYAEKGRILSFEVGKYTDSTDPLTVEYSNDKNDWVAMEGGPLTSGGVKEFVAPEDGFYYLRFRGRYGRIDNFSGFRLAPKEHDLSIISQDIPASGHQYVEYTATATLKEMMGKNEKATARLLVNGEEKGKVTQDIGPNETQTISLFFTPLESLEDTEVLIVVAYAENESVKSQPIEVTFAEAPVWDENDMSDLGEGTIPAVVFNYTPTERWNTISVPFSLNDEHLAKIYGDSFLVFELESYDGLTIRFHEAVKMDGKYAAGYPYVVYTEKSGMSVTSEDNSPADEDSPAIVLKNIKIEQPTPQSETKNGVTFSARYALTETPEGEKTYDIDSDFHSLTEVSSVKGFHAAITLDPSITKVPAVEFYDRFGVETGISIHPVDKTGIEGIFNLNGIPAKEPLAPGIYIVNGKKIIVPSK